MEIYDLQSIVSMPTHGALVGLEDASGLLDILVYGEAGEVGRIRGNARNIPLKLLKKADYVESIVSIPLFSEKMKNLFENSGDAVFHECIVEGEGEELLFFAAEIVRFIPVLLEDPHNPLKMYVPCRDNISEDFYMARDARYRGFGVYSKKFVDLCAEHKCNIIARRIDPKSGKKIESIQLWK